MKSVLVLDDQEVIVAYVTQILTDRGYRILPATHAADALEALRRNEVHLVILDVQMPERNGLEVYREIKKIRNVPVLFVTGFPDSFSVKAQAIVEMVQEDFMEGTTDILYKPFEIQALLEKVEALIGLSEDPGGT